MERVFSAPLGALLLSQHLINSQRSQGHWHKVINLVVVFWTNEKAPSAIAIPPTLIRMLTSGGFEDPKAPLIMTGDFVWLRFIERNGRYFIRNHDHEITAMLNRFDRVEAIGTDTEMFPPYACWADGPARPPCRRFISR